MIPLPPAQTNPRVTPLDILQELPYRSCRHSRGGDQGQPVPQMSFTAESITLNGNVSIAIFARPTD